MHARAVESRKKEFHLLLGWTEKSHKIPAMVAGLRNRSFSRHFLNAKQVLCTIRARKQRRDSVMVILLSVGN
jgi:hypothetical protein